MGVGVVATAAGLLGAAWVTQPWHLYLTLGVLVGAGSSFLGYTGQALFLPNWFARRRGLAIGIAYAGVGVGSIVMFPWFQALIEQAGWRSACATLGVVVLVVAGPLNLLLRRRPEDLGLRPDGDAAPAAGTTARAPLRVVDPAWAAVDWTLAHAMRTARFWWVGLALFCGLYAWYAVQVHQTQVLVETGYTPAQAAWALGAVSLFGIPGQIALGHLSDRVGREIVWTLGCLGFALTYSALLLLAPLGAHPALLWALANLLQR
jgi:MFS family permease